MVKNEVLYLRNVNEATKTTYWEQCQALRVPYIIADDKGLDYAEIYCDYVDMFDNEGLRYVSDTIKEFYDNYLTLWGISRSLTCNYLDQYYIFTLLVKKEHVDYVAKAIYEFLFRMCHSYL